MWNSLIEAAEIMVDLHRAGISLRRSGADLQYWPKNRMTSYHLELLKLNKPELLALLDCVGDTRAGYCPKCNVLLLGVPTFDGYLNRVCLQCATWFRCVSQKISPQTSQPAPVMLPASQVQDQPKYSQRALWSGK